MLFNFLAVIYVFVCAFLILVVLLQAGRGGGLGGSFGAGGSSQTVFGSAGASNFLTKLTWVCAVLFMLLSGTLAYLSSTSDSLLDEQTRISNERRAAREVGNTVAPTAAVPGAVSDPTAPPAAEEPAAADEGAIAAEPVAEPAAPAAEPAAPAAEPAAPAAE